MYHVWQVVNCVLHSGDVSNPCRAWETTYVRMPVLFFFGGRGVEPGVEMVDFPTGFTWVISHVPIEHHPTIRYMVQ